MLIEGANYVYIDYNNSMVKEWKPISIIRIDVELGVSKELNQHIINL